MSRQHRFGALVKSVLVLTLAACASFEPLPSGVTPAPQDDRVSPAEALIARQAFERLQTLEGRWRGTVRSPDGLVSEVTSDFRITSEGNAVMERGIIGDPMETTTIYYLDRGVLRVTHYCAVGNQPRMYLDARTSSDRLRFSFDQVTNLGRPGAFHMRLQSLEIEGDSVLHVGWHGVRDGDVLPAGVIRMRRMSRGDPFPG